MYIYRFGVENVSMSIYAANEFYYTAVCVFYL